MFEPMFRNEVLILGIDPRLVTLAIGIAGTAIGWWWFRRALDIEPEIHSFRATTPARPNWLLRAGFGLGFAVLALVAIALPR